LLTEEELHATLAGGRSGRAARTRRREGMSSAPRGHDSFETESKEEIASLHSLRGIQPSSELVERIDSALRRAEVEEGEKRDSRARRTRLLGMVTVIVLPTLVLIMQLSRANSPFVPMNTSTQEVRISETGAVVLDLSDSLARPERVFPHLTLRVPRTLRVHGIPTLQRTAPAANCDERECTVEWRNLTRAVRDLSVTVAGPGTYELRVERSDGKRRQKDLVLVRAAR
jgi:hypothetical protein